MRARRLYDVGLLLLAVLGFLLRLAPLGRYVTPDEPAWVERSIRFADALASRDLAAIPSTGHPGVTTMWLGAAGVAVRRWLSPAESTAHLNWIRQLAWLAPENGEAFRHLIPFLPWGRVVVALVSILGLVVLFPLLTRLFDRRTACLAVILLAFDPFLIGHSGLLHTDALLAIFSLLALVAALNGLREPQRAAWWGLSGLFVALAILTKTPALILSPFILSLLIVRHLQSTIRDSQPLIHRAPRAIHHGALFILSSLLFFFVLYPALWSGPVATLRKLFSFAGHHVQMAQRPIFFAGRMTYDPGLIFYPTVFLFRVSPFVLIGLAGALIAWRRLSFDRRFVFLALLVFAVLFGAGMSLGAKKHDRYLLSAFPPLTLAGVLGLRALLDRYARRLASQSDLLIVLFQVLIALLFAAYPLSYFNPLLGGPAVAARVLPTGWGEGWGVAARRLSQLPNARQLTVAALNVPSFAPFFEGRTMPLETEADTLALSDYVVATSTVDRLSDLPVYQTIHLPARQTTTIYTNTAPLKQADYLSAHAGQDDLILIDADTPLQRRYEGPGTLRSAASLPDGAAIADWLAEQVPAHEITWLVASSGASPITSALLRRQLETIATPADTVTLSSATITRLIPRSSLPASRPSPYRATFGGRLALVDASFPPTAAWPHPLLVTLRWRAQTDPLTDYQAVVTLRDEDGHPWAVAESLVRNEVNFPTSAWEGQEWSDVTYDLGFPPGIPPNRYAVEISLYDRVTGARLGAVGPDGTFRGTRVPVGEMRVARPVAPPDVALLDVPERVDVSVGPLTLLGGTPPAAQVLSGDHLSFALFWQADAVPKTDYDIRLQWVDSDEQVELETVEPLSAYPTSHWRAGDRFQSHHRVHVSPDVPPGSYRLMLGVLNPGGEVVGKGPRDAVYPLPLATVEILPRERSFTLPDGIAHRSDLTFGERIHLVGYEVGSVEVAPGETLPLTLCWRADDSLGAQAVPPVERRRPDGREAKRPPVDPEATDRSYTFFVHLLGPDGLPHGQVDRIPGAGGAPTTSWAAGQVVVDKIDLPVDPDASTGGYQIAVGFYDASYGDRLPVTDRSGEALPDKEEPSLAHSQAILPVEITVSGDGS